MIERLRGLGDRDSVAILELILREEVAHVATGSRWFAWCCDQRGLAPEPTFRALLATHAPGLVRGPFNLEARRAAGFSDAETEWARRTVRDGVRIAWMGRFCLPGTAGCPVPVPLCV
jgi:uncharacterized ferritin-like protein (DUF455 family)